jgi:hypothetical protein
MTHDDLPRDRDIDWLLNVSASAIGQRGTLSSVVSILERGGPSNLSGTNPDNVTDEQLLAVGRLRRLVALWNRVPAEHRLVLRAYYESAQHPTGVRESLNRLAGVAVILNDKHTLDACRHLVAKDKHLKAAVTKIARDRVSDARQRALTAVVLAHEAVDAARESIADEWGERA